MNSHSSRKSQALCALAASVVCISAQAVEPREIVTVEAAREVIVGRSAIGATIKEISISHRVSYDDLDLASPQGAAVLEMRVRDAAKSACEELARYPMSMTGAPKNCVNDAIGRAAPEMREAIDAAKVR